MYELDNQDHTVVSTALKDNNEEVSKDRWWAPIYLVICIIFSIFLGIAVVCAIVFIVLGIIFGTKGDREAQDNYFYALLFTCLLIVLFFAIAFMCFLFYDSPELDLVLRVKMSKNESG